MPERIGDSFLRDAVDVHGGCPILHEHGVVARQFARH